MALKAQTSTPATIRFENGLHGEIMQFAEDNNTSFAEANRKLCKAGLDADSLNLKIQQLEVNLTRRFFETLCVVVNLKPELLAARKIKLNQIFKEEIL
jgi:hypothetical protein